MNSYEKESEQLIELINHIFETLKNNPITNPSDFANEMLIKKLLIEVEPEIEMIVGKIDIVRDSTFPIRYSNMVLLINSIDSYLEYCYEKSKIINRVPVKKLILVNELLKGEDYQIFAVIELLILISALSSKKDYFLDKVGECEEHIINLYLSFAEKYIPLESRNDCNESLININSSLIRYGSMDNSSKIIGVLNEKLNKKLEETEKEKNILLRSINELDSNLREEKKKSQTLEAKLLELENKQKDYAREIEMVRSTDNLSKLQQEMLEEAMMMSNIKSELKNKEMELEDKCREIAQLKKFHSDEISAMREKIDNLQELLSASKDQSKDIEKLKMKIKELQVFKDKQADFDELMFNYESKSRMNDNLLADKQGLTTQLEKYSKEILNEKEKLRKKEYEFKQLSIDIQELKKEKTKLENLLKLKDNYDTRTTDLSKIESKHNIPQVQLNLGDLDNSLFEYEKGPRDDRINLIERELLELKSDKAELLKNYKQSMDEILKLTTDNQALELKVEEKDREIKILKSDKDKYDLEREKIEVKTQKFDIELQKKTLAIEKLELEKNKMEKMEADIKENKEKLSKIQNERQIMIKDYEKTIEKLTKDKAVLSAEVGNLKLEIEKQKSQYETQSKIKS